MKCPIMCKMSKNCSFWHLDGNTMLLTPESDLCFRAHTLLVTCYATLHPALSVHPSVCLLVCRSVHPSVCHTLLFLRFCGFWPHCSCPKGLVTSIMAPAHPHATGVAVYPALSKLLPLYICIIRALSNWKIDLDLI